VSRKTTSVPPIPREEKRYFNRIEERFCALRGAAMLLSPRDWALIGEWWKEEIPLAVVLESLEEVFRARIGRGEAPGRIGSLAYVRHEVERRWELQRELRAATREPAAESYRLQGEIRRHLGRLARRLREVASSAQGEGREEMARVLSEIEAGLKTLLPREAVQWDPGQAESILEKMDSELLQAAREALDREDRARLAAEAEAALEPRRGAMRPRAFAETRRALEDHLLRRRWGIPRLSLLAED